MRRLPLAVGYKTTLTTLPLSLSHLIPKEVELAVTGIETVKVTAGEFKCYKVSLASLGQTFWFGVEGARPLVKYKSGDTEAELVKMWGAENFIETELGFFPEAGWKFSFTRMGPGPDCSGKAEDQVRTPEGSPGVEIAVRKTYTPAAEIAQALRDGLDKQKCNPVTIQTRTIGGQQAVSCFVAGGSYHVWIRSERAAIDLSGSPTFQGPAIYRWQLDRVLATAKRIP